MKPLSRISAILLSIMLTVTMMPLSGFATEQVDDGSQKSEQHAVQEGQQNDLESDDQTTGTIQPSEGNNSTDTIEESDEGESSEGNKESNQLRVLKAPASPMALSSGTGEAADPFVVTTFEELEEAIAEGGFIKLDADISLESTIVIDNDVTLDLNKKTLTGMSTKTEKKRIDIASGANVTIKNGTINSSTIIDPAPALGKAPGAALIKNEGNLTIGTGSSSAKVDMNADDTLIWAKAGTLTINNWSTGTMTSKYGNVVATNGSGSGSPNNSAEAIVNIKGGKLVSTNDIAIYAPAGTFNITGGTMEGATGIYAKGGVVYISGGEITGTGSVEAGTAMAFTHNTSGAYPTGDALVLESSNYPYSPVQADVTGGTFRSTSGKPVAAYATPGYDAATKIITGGYFNKTPEISLLEDGYQWIQTSATLLKVVSDEEADEDYVFEYTPNDKTKPVQKSTAINLATFNDGTVKLLADGKVASIGNTSRYNLTINLNGHTLEAGRIYASKNISSNASGSILNIVDNSRKKGGQLILTKPSNPSTSVMYMDASLSDVRFTIGEGVTVKGSIDLFGNSATSNNSLTINGTVDATGYGCAAINTNGSTTKSGTITIGSTGVIKSDDGIAMYLPGKADVVIEDGSIVSGTTAIYQKSGTLSVKGGTITATGEAADYEYNGNGANETGDAIVVDSCGYPGGKPTLTITGTPLITSANAAGIGDYVYNNNEKPIITSGSNTITLPNGEKWVEEPAGSGTYVIGEATYLDPVKTEIYINDKVEIAVKNLPAGDVKVSWKYAPSNILGSGGWDNTPTSPTYGTGKPYGIAPGKGTATLTITLDGKVYETLVADVTVKDVSARVDGTEYTINEFNDAVSAAKTSGSVLEVYTLSNRITLQKDEELKVKAADNRGKGSVSVSAPPATETTMYRIDKTEDAATGITTYRCEEAGGPNVEYTAPDGTKSYSASLSIGSKAGTYKLLRDFSNGRISVSAKDGAVLDLNGHTISFAVEEDNYAAIMLGSASTKGVLTIRDSSENGGGKIVNTGSYAIWSYRTKSNVIIEGGEIEAALVDVYTTSGCTAEIKGGTFKVSGANKGFILNCEDTNKGTITVSGGTFYEFDPSNNSADGQNTNYVVEGRGVVVGEDGGVTTYTVKPILTVTAKDSGIFYGDDLSGKGVTYAGLEDADKDENGEPKAGVISGTLAYESDYDKADNDKNTVGDYTLTPKGLTSDKYIVAFEDGKLTVGKKSITFTWPAKADSTFVYDGAQHSVAATADAVNGDTLTLTYAENEATNAGSYTAKVTAIAGDRAANYELDDEEPTTAHKWEITKAPLSFTWKWSGGYKVSADRSEVEYRGDDFGYAPIAEINNAIGDDVVAVGSTSVIRPKSGVIGEWTYTVLSLAGDDKDNYMIDPAGETTSYTFNVVKADIADAQADPIDDMVYDGEAKTPKPVVKFGGATLEEGKDYELSYEDNTAIGDEAKVIITAKDDSCFKGTKEVSFKIVAADKSALDEAISNAKEAEKDVKVSEDGKDVRPGEKYTTAAEKKALDDAIAAAEGVLNNKNATEAEIAKAISDLNAAIDTYEEAKKDGKKPQTVGTTVIRNTIANTVANPKYMDVLYDAVPGATSYDMAYKNRNSKNWVERDKGNTTRAKANGLTVKSLYEIKIRAKKAETATQQAVIGKWSPTIYRYFFTVQKIRLKSASKGSFTMSWDKDKDATGYQVMFTTNSNGAGAANNINTVGKDATSFTKSGLKSGQTYYVQVRALKKVGDTTYVGNISKPVAVKVK